MTTVQQDKKSSLERFIDAQNTCYEEIIQELGRGLKTSHWIWYIFPQVVGLGFSEYSVYYGIKGLLEAKAYWDNDLLRARYEECLQLIMDSHKRPEEVLGVIDAKKLQSSLTLFLQVDGESETLNAALKNLYAKKLDMNTIAILST